MNLSAQIKQAFDSGESAVVIEPKYIGPVAITEKRYTDAYGDAQTSYTAHLLTKGREAKYQASSPMKALIGLTLAAGGRS